VQESKVGIHNYYGMRGGGFKGLNIFLEQCSAG